MTLLASIATRASAILTGTYPVGTPYLTASTFAETPVMMPLQNPEFPGGSRKAAANRRFDLTWERLGFDPPGSENGCNGPWVRSATLLVRVQYEIARPNKLAPPDADLALGALEAASRHAIDDAAAIQWAFLRPGAFADLALGVLLDQDAAVEKADSLRAVGSTRVRFLVAQSAASSPGLW